MKIMHKDGVQTETVMTADNILGPYEMVKEGLRPLGMSAGDFDLAVASEREAYYYFERVLQKPFVQILRMIIPVSLDITVHIFRICVLRMFVRQLHISAEKGSII